MNITITDQDAHRRVNGAVSLTYKAGKTYSVPKVFGEALIESGGAILASTSASDQKQKEQ